MNPSPFNNKSTAEEVAAALQDSIRGKNVFLVGATAKSLGAEFLRVIAPYANIIWVAGRTEPRFGLQAAIDEAMSGIPLYAPKPKIHLVKLDMTSFESIRHAADIVNAQGQPIDVLLMNVMVFQSSDLRRSTEGFEAQLAGNHIGIFLLTSLILPRLRQAKSGARVIQVSSSPHGFALFRWNDPNYRNCPDEYDGCAAHTDSKFANALFTRELAKRLAPEGIFILTLHPGRKLVTSSFTCQVTIPWQHLGVILTGGMLAFSDEIYESFGCTKKLDGTWNIPAYFPAKCSFEGVGSYVVAAFDPSIKDQPGSYVFDNQVQNELLAPAINEENAEKLWKMTEEWVGAKVL